jgi:uncharacterized protein (TIRG00374 family)
VTAKAKTPSKGRLSLLLRVLASALLMGLVIRRVDWGVFVATVKAADPLYLSLSLLVSPVLVLISAWKWQLLLHARDLSPGLPTCYRLYLVGYFFNNFLPTNVGGDVVRGYILGKRQGNQAAVMASVFLERFTGISALVVMALLALPFGPVALYDLKITLGVAAVVAAYLVLLWAVVDRRALALTRRWVHLPFMGKVVRLQEAIEAYRGHGGVLLACIGLSLLFYLGAAINVMVSARAFGASLSLTQAILVTPVILLISLLPFSLGGIGLSEWAYYFALGKYGISAESALSTALLMRLKNVLLGLLGGVGHAVTREAAPLRQGQETPVAGGEGDAS